MPSCSGLEGEKWNFLMIDLRDDLVTGYLMPPIWISNVLDMTYWLAQTYLKIINHKFTVQRECGNGPLQATLSGDVIILRGCVRRNSGPFGGRENWHGYWILAPYHCLSIILFPPWVDPWQKATPDMDTSWCKIEWALSSRSNSICNFHARRA